MACRSNALNKILSPPISKKEFAKYCDLFDKINKMPIGTSELYFYSGLNDSTIFSFVLEEKQNIKSVYIPLTEFAHSKLTELVSSNADIKNIIVFDKRHAWTLRKNNNEWFDENNEKNKNKSRKIVQFPLNCGFVVCL
jgi:hypothetical protein